MLYSENLDKIDEMDDAYNGELVILFEHFRFIENKHNVEICQYINYNGYYECSNNIFFNSLKTLERFRELGKEFLKLYRENFNTINDFVNSSISDKNIKSKLISIYDGFIKSYGYPYSNNYEKSVGSSIPSFTRDTLMLFIIHEIHIWIFKIKSGDHKGYSSINKVDTTPTQMFEYYVSLIIDELIYSLENFPLDLSKLNNINIYDTRECLLNTEFDYEKNGDEYFRKIRTALICWVVNKIRNENFILTKQTPIYNDNTNRFRIYHASDTIMGIAYNRLLLNLTSGKYSYIRKICSIPECTNEFEKNGKIKYCQKCIDDNIPSKIKHMKYNNSKKGRERKLKFTEKKKDN